MDKIRTIYQKLHSRFGPQYWWPVTEYGKFHPACSGGQINAHCDYCKNIYTRRGMD